MPASSSTRRKLRALRSTLETIARMAKMAMKKMPQAIMTSSRQKAVRERGSEEREGARVRDAWCVVRVAGRPRHRSVLRRQFIGASTPGAGRARRSPARW